MAEDAAVGERRPNVTRSRKAIFFLLRATRKLVKRRKQTASSDVHFVPAPLSREELADLVARFNWYLGDVATSVSIDGTTLIDITPEDAPFMEPSLVHQPRAYVEHARPNPHLLIHRVTPGAVGKGLLARGNFSIVDPRFYYLTDSFAYFALRGNYANAASTHEAALAEFFRRSTSSRSALVVGTGPSAREVMHSSIDHDVRVVCNSAVRDRKLLQHVRPTVVAFADHVFHFGPSRYAAAFRKDVRNLCDWSDCLFAAPDYASSLLLEHIPELEDRLISIAQEPAADQWRTLSRDDTRVRVTGNVLTQLMLPIAMTLATTIDIAGCDGRKPGEQYFWSHGRDVQYSDDLMRSVFQTHLAFFRDNDYRDYYAKHCADLAALIEWGESRGHQFRSVTPSFIPALANRTS